MFTGMNQRKANRQISYWESDRDHPPRMERQLGEVSQLLALVLMGQECLECVWSVWKRSFQLSWWGSHQGKAPAGPAVCKERRTCGGWRPSGAQGSQILGAVRRGILRTATLDLQRTDCGLFRSLVDKSPLGDSVKGLQSIPQEGNPKGTEAEMWFSGGLGSVWLEDLKGLSQPKWFHYTVL